MLQQLQQLIHSIIKSLEVLYVLEETKPCSRMLIFEDGLNNAIDFLNKNNICTAISDFKVIKQNIQSEFYSDKSVKIPKDDSQKGYFIVYLSKNKETAEKAKAAEAGSKHYELGLLLGYPKCCCEFFEKNFNEKNTDLTLKVLENSSGYEFPFYNNIAARHFDIALLSHFPHSFECRPSIEIAKANFNVIEKHSSKLAALFSQILQSVVVYTMGEGIFLLNKYERVNDKITYSNILTSAKSKLYYLLASNKELKIIDKNNFVVRDINIKGEPYAIMIFT